MIIPSDVDDIQAILYQVWNFNDIGFGPNGKWIKVMCTYKLQISHRVRRIQTGEYAPFN